MAHRANLRAADPFNIITRADDRGHVKIGNISTEGIVTSGGLNASQSFAYDAYNQLLTASEAGAWSQSNSYDQVRSRAASNSVANLFAGKRGGDGDPAALHGSVRKEPRERLSRAEIIAMAVP